MSRAVLTVWAAMLVFSFAPIRAAECSLLLQVVDVRGQPLKAEEYEAELRTSNSSRTFRLGGKPVFVECRDYHLWVRRVVGLGGYYFSNLPLWRDRALRVSLSGADLFDSPLPTTLQAELQGVGDREIWMRLTPLHDNMTGVRDLVIHGDGLYQFDDIQPGRYILVVMHEGNVLATREATVYLTQTVTVDKLDLSSRETP